MKLLVTGAAGFIGSHVVDLCLSKGHQVVGIDNFNDYYDVSIKENNVSRHVLHPHYELVRDDIENEEALRRVFSQNKIDAVIHLAARAGVRPSLERPLDYVKTNILGTTGILNEMVRSGVKKMVFASSSSVYGNCAAEFFSEDLKVTEPISPYAATKSACEQLCYTYHHLYGIKTVCLRFFTVYGPRQRPDLAIRKFIDKIERGDPIRVYGDGTTRRDYTFVADIVDGIYRAVAYEGSGYEIINLGGGEPITLKRMIETIEKVLGKSAQIVHMPMQPGDVEKTVCDWSKARRLLGYSPKTKFEDGIRKFVEWRSEEHEKSI